MKTIVVPVNKMPWRSYTYEYVNNILDDFIACGYSVSYYDEQVSNHFANSGCFIAYVNGKKVLFDQSEYYDNNSWRCDAGVWIINDGGPRYEYASDIPIFKRMKVLWSEYPKNVFPLGPFVDPKGKKLALSMGYSYIGTKNTLVHTNRVYMHAVYTRKIAFEKLNLPKSIIVDSERTGIEQYYRKLITSFGCLNITGASTYTQDSSSIEAMLLGACVVSNNFDIEMPYNKAIKGDEHYICIREEDYSDINEKILFAFNNRPICKDIGQKAYNLMQETVLPRKRVEWVEQTVEEFYG